MGASLAFALVDQSIIAVSDCSLHPAVSAEALRTKHQTSQVALSFVLFLRHPSIISV
jgi:hypothetical protein